jgi:hypothetical protein
MPFPTATLMVFILRDIRRNLFIDGPLFGMLFVVQLVSGNRIALAVAMIVGVTLITTERRLPRWVFPLLVAGYLFTYTGGSGFTALLRTDKGELMNENPVVASLREAYLGNNLIDIRDASWVFGNWDYDPLLGRTYLAGLAAFVPSALFPERKEWHLGLTCIRIVGWDEEKHFGIRITFFGESFLNFGWAGVIGLGVLIGTLYAVLLHLLHLARNDATPCLYRNLRIVTGMQMCYPLSNSSNAFTFWAMLSLLVVLAIVVETPARWITLRRNLSPSVAKYLTDSPDGA